MRGLLLFIGRHHIFFLFLLLETLCVYFIIRNNNYHNASFFNSTNAVTGTIYEYYSEITEYFHLKQSNELLASENAALKESSAQAYIAYTNRVFTVGDSIYKQKYTYLDARVINNTITKRNNYLTLDKGSLHGITPEMGVIAADGVVGIVKDVSDNFSSVLSLLNKNTIISSKLKKSGYLGSLAWQGGNPKKALLSDVPKHARIAKGDTVITSGASAIFPEGVLVGFIEEFTIEPGANFYTIKVNLSTDFGKLSYVYIVKNLMKEEQEKLEEATQNDI